MKIETLPNNRGFLVDDYVIEFSGLVLGCGGKRLKHSQIPPYILEAKERLLDNAR